MGMSKGSIILLHTRQLKNIFVRLTVHREAILIVKYLPCTRMFISNCAEKFLKIWRCHDTLKKA